MAKIIITIDGDNVTINQSATPTKVETSTTKRCFIIMGHCNESSWIEFVSDNYIEAANKLKVLKSYDDNDHNYILLIQNELGRIQSCKGLDWDIN